MDSVSLLGKAHERIMMKMFSLCVEVSVFGECVRKEKKKVNENEKYLKKGIKLVRLNYVCCV